MVSKYSLGWCVNFYNFDRENLNQGSMYTLLVGNNSVILQTTEASKTCNISDYVSSPVKVSEEEKGILSLIFNEVEVFIILSCEIIAQNKELSEKGMTNAINEYIKTSKGLLSTK